MSVNLDNILFHSQYNAFKNNSVQRGSLDLPSSLGAGAEYTDTITFTLSEDVSFIQIYCYSTDYNEYFRYLDSAYHDNWRLLQMSEAHLVLNSPVTSLHTYYLSSSVAGDTVTVTLTMKNITGGTITYTPNLTVPITFIEYTLAN